MNPTRTLLVAVLLVLLCVPCYSAATAENDVLSKADDTRLDQPVTFSADCIRLVDVLSQLSGSTSVTMTAGVDANDWMVLDRRLIVYVSSMKLRDLMRELSSVLRFTWTRTGEPGKWSYNLGQDKQQRLEEDSLRTNAEDGQSRKIREKRENAIADMGSLGALSAKDAEALKTTSPWRYVLATEPLGKDVAEFFNQLPDARNAFAQGTEASFPVSTLSSQVQDIVRRIAVSYDSLSKSIGASEDHSKLIAGLERLQITINHHVPLPGAGKDVLSRSILGRIMIGNGVESFEIPLFDPSSGVGKALGTAIVSLRSGKAKDAVAKRLEADMLAAADAPEDNKESARDISSDPALAARVKLFDQVTNAPLQMTLKGLADSSKLNIISDCFPGVPVSMAGGERPLGEQLEAIRLAYGANWEKSGKVVRFRDTEWFKKRAWEVPQVWIDYWVARAKQNDSLLLSDLVQIGCLRDDQLDHSIMTNPTMMNLGAGDASRNRHILRFYGSLDEDQKKSIGSDQLLVSQLSVDQWSVLQRALATKGAAYAAAAKGVQFVKLTQAGSDVVEYDFSYYPSPSEQPVVFKLRTGLAFKGSGEVVFPEGKHETFVVPATEK